MRFKETRYLAGFRSSEEENNTRRQAFIVLQMAFDVFINTLDIIIDEPSLSQQGYGFGSNGSQICLVARDISAVSLSEHSSCARSPFHCMIDPLDTVVAQYLRQDGRAGEQYG